MAEGDRPNADGRGVLSRLRVLRGGGTRRARSAGAPVSPAEVSRRLAALERRVQRALATGGSEREALAPDVVRGAVDGLLGALVEVRRGGVRDWLVGGESRAALERRLLERVGELLYAWWWRVEVVGLERVPASGRVLLVANRGGALVPYEALVLKVALARGGREAHPLLDEWSVRAPVLGPLLARGGVLRATSAARRVLAREGAIVTFPESRPVVAKPFTERYRLARFGRGTFARMAIEMRTPIVPVAVIGSEETHPVLARLDAPGRLLGLPTLPITPTFPWLGLAGLVPLPTKWTLLVGEPLDVASRHEPGDAGSAAAVGRLRDQVRERLQALILEGLRRRRRLF